MVGVFLNVVIIFQLVTRKYHFPNEELFFQLRRVIFKRELMLQLKNP